MESSPRIFLSAGEASGDAYGAALITALRKRLPQAAFSGLGGRQMEQAGQQRVVHAEDVAVMGLTEILRHVPSVYAKYRKLVSSIRSRRPDVAVLIDFPDVNFRLAKHLRRAGVRVVWFVSPQLWAWKRGRLRWVQQRVDKMLVIFPFEETFYRNRGVDAEFVGHPLAEALAAPLPVAQEATQPATQAHESGLPVVSPQNSRLAYAAQHHLDSAKTWIALLPGSRWKEIHANLPTLHELAMSDLISGAAAHTTFNGNTTLQPSNPAEFTHYEFLLPVASTIESSALQRYIEELNAEHLKYFGPEASTLRLTLVPDAAEALFHARASVVASGTATVLAALVGNPFVMVYRVSALTFALAKRLVQYPEELQARRDLNGNLPVSMVNLIAQHRLVPELLQDRFTAANVATALGPLLKDGPERERQIRGLQEVRQRLVLANDAESAQHRSPIERVADAVARLLLASPDLVQPHQ
jgi:lipid-A-disaccharide synthase